METTATAKTKFLVKRILENGVEFTLGNGQVLVALLDAMPPAIVLRLALHGLSQKVGDSSAGCAGDKAYGHAFAVMKGVIESLEAGKWGVERESGALADLVTALAQIKKLDEEAVRAAVMKADEATRKGWMKNAKVEAVVLEIKAKRAKANAKEAVEDLEFNLEG